MKHLIRIIPLAACVVFLVSCGKPADTSIKEAEQGNADAQFILGLRYSNGNPAEAVKWLRKAAEQGHGKAQFVLGFTYAVGRGIPKDSAEAAKWYRKAAEQGYDNAQYNLGVAYAYGAGVPKDYVEAEKWIRKAAEQGYAEAHSFLNRFEDLKGQVAD